jgi:hypothetical protein
MYTARIALKGLSRTLDASTNAAEVLYAAARIVSSAGSKQGQQRALRAGSLDAAGLKELPYAAKADPTVWLPQVRPVSCRQELLKYTLCRLAMAVPLPLS